LRPTPPAAPTTGKAQPTINARTHATTLAAKGRHNPSVLPRAVLMVEVMVEAMVALVLADHLLRQRGQCSLW
jgi:chorismate synthase